ncbi:MAG: hypothetical protein NTV34_08120 [Proteobacteria bacterium]|nr:hypothetical protein [Pseudomonadota bacterium]
MKFKILFLLTVISACRPRAESQISSTRSKNDFICQSREEESRKLPRLHFVLNPKISILKVREYQSAFRSDYESSDSCKMLLSGYTPRSDARKGWIRYEAATSLDAAARGGCLGVAKMIFGRDSWGDTFEKYWVNVSPELSQKGSGAVELGFKDELNRAFPTQHQSKWTFQCDSIDSP